MTTAAMAKWTLQVVRFEAERPPEDGVVDMVSRVVEVDHRIGETIPVTVAGTPMTTLASEHWEVGDLITIAVRYDRVMGGLTYPGLARHLKVGDRLTVTTEEPRRLEVTHVGR